MSELDYELAEMSSPGVVEMVDENESLNCDLNEMCIDSPEISSPNNIEMVQTNDTKVETNEVDNSSEPVEMHSPEINEMSEFEDDEIQILEVIVGHKQKEIPNDLEEGEINELNDNLNNNNNTFVCKYYRKGICYMGENCRFLHLGVSSYKMFEPHAASSPFNPNPILPDEISQEENLPDIWEKGLKEMKERVKKAKVKKETDLDFEEKQLYQDLEYGMNNNSSHYKKMYLYEKHRKRKKVLPDSYTPSRSKSLERVIERKKNYKKTPGSQTLKNLTWRTRYRSNSSSRQIRSFYSDADSSSTCSCYSYESRHAFQRIKSKLERAYTRALHTPKRSRSRRQTYSRRTVSSYPRRRSLSRDSFIKRSTYRSYSKSPLRKIKPKKASERDFAHKLYHRKPISPPYSFYSEKERKSSFSKSDNYGLRSLSSDMTVSSIKCTSVSFVTSGGKKSVKSSVIVPKKISSDKRNSARCKRIDETSHAAIQKWLDSIPKSKNRSEKSSSEKLNKIGDKKEEKNSKPIVNRKIFSRNEHNHSSSIKKFNKIGDKKEGKNSKPVVSHKILSRNDHNQSSCINSDSELSEAEKELLKYIPGGNSKPGQKEISNDKAEVEKPSLEPTLKYLPPKIVYDDWSDTKSPPKLVRNNESSSSKIQLTENPNNYHGISVENDSTKDCNSEAQDNASTEAQEVNQSNDTNKLGKRPRQKTFSASELELLKYACIGDPELSEEIREQNQKVPPKNTVSTSSKISSNKSAGQDKLTETTVMLRKEQLMTQLKAVKLAIATKKRLLKRESYAKRKP